MKLKYATWLLLTCVWACKPQIVLTRMALPNGSNEMPIIPANDAGGIYYALPMSIVTVDVPLVKIVRAKGICFKADDVFCEKLLEERVGKKTGDILKKWWAGGKDSSDISYELKEKEVTIGTRPAPDPSKVYYATLKGQWNKNQQLAMTLNELGQMTKGEFVNENRTFDLIVQSISSAAGIVSAISPLKDAAGTTESLKTQWDNIKKADACQQMAENLLAVRAARFDQLKNPQNTGDGTIFKRKLEELDALEAKLIAGLTFGEEKTKVVLHFDILVPTPANPTPADIASALSQVPLIAFSPSGGIELIAKPATGSYQNDYLTYFGRQVSSPSSGFEVYYLTFDYTPGAQFADRMYTPTNNSQTVPGIAYNIPVMVRGRVQAINGREAKSPIAMATLSIPQLGKVAYLPERASKVGAELDPGTGALRIVSLQQTGLSVDQIKAAGEAIGTGATALKKPAAKTELEQIQTDNSLLEQQIKKLRQQKTLDSLSNGGSRGSQ